MIHPVARRALGDSEESNTLQFKLFSDQCIEVQSLRDNIPPEDRGRAIMGAHLSTKALVDFEGEERDLSLIIRFEIEESVAFQTSPSEALNGFDFQHGMFSRRLLVVAEIIVTWTNVKVTDDRWHVLKLALDFAEAQTESMRHSAVLIAGGKSTRMGRDKAQMLVNGEPLWQRQLSVLRETVPVQLLISGPTDGPYSGAGVVVVPDREPGCGPLGGLAAALEVCASDWLLVLAVDMPFMTPAYLRTMVGECMEQGQGLIPENSTGHLDPLAAVYPRAAYSVTVELLRGGERRLSALVEALEQARMVRRRKIAAADEHLFANWNSPEDLRS